MYYDPSKKIESLSKIRSQLYKHKFRTIEGKEETILALRCDNANDIDPLCPGYILTHDGALLPVVEGDVHPYVANNYLKKYLGKKLIDLKLQGKTYMDILLDIHAGQYIGPRIIDGDISGREVMFLTGEPPFSLCEEQIDKLILLERSIMDKGLVLVYHGRGMTTYTNLLSEDINTKKR